MITERFFLFRAPRRGWIVWDRHKNEAIATFPDSPKGKTSATSETAMLNRQQRERDGEIHPQATPS
jgi:hypothetical protein